MLGVGASHRRGTRLELESARPRSRAPGRASRRAARRGRRADAGGCRRRARGWCRAGRRPMVRPLVTASTASRLKSPTNTPSRPNSDRASSPSRSMLHSTVAWMVRCRSGTSRAAVTSSGSTRSSLPSIAAGVRARMRAAASSIASGTPSSARQMRATSSAFSSVTSNLGSADRARSRNSRTAGRLEDGLDRGLRRLRRQAERFDVEDLFAAHAEPNTTRHEERRARQVGEERDDVGSGVDDLLEVVEHDEVASPGAGDPQLLDSAAHRRSRGPRPPARSRPAPRRGRAPAPVPRTSPGRSARPRCGRPRWRGGSCRCRRGRRA